MFGIRFAIAVVVSVLAVGGFFFAGAIWRIGPLAISTLWAIAEIWIERRRRARQQRPPAPPA
jgi:hypothetical protein